MLHFALPGEEALHAGLQRLDLLPRCLEVPNSSQLMLIESRANTKDKSSDNASGSVERPAADTVFVWGWGG